MNSLVQSVRRHLARRGIERAIRRMRDVNPAKLQALSEQRVLAAFQRTARLVPAYRRFLRERGIRPVDVRSIENFKRLVPVIDKGVFAENELRELCVGGNLDGISLFWSSSGHSGAFSYGIETRRDARRTAKGVDFMMQNTFRALDRRTLLINCLPMGVKVPSRLIPLAETALRADVVWALVDKLRHDFEQFVLIGEHLFLKKLIEEGMDQGVPWKEITVHVLTGAEYVAEDYRSYLAGLLGIDLGRPETGTIRINFGLSELCLTIFSEQEGTMAIRRRALADEVFREQLCGRRTEMCPNVMQYYPDNTFIETIPGPDGNELVVSLLDPRLKLPLIRYNTRDIVRLLPHQEMRDLLERNGMGGLSLPFKLPFGVAWGKQKYAEAPDGRRVTPEQVKEAIYADAEVAGSVTGTFRLMKARNDVCLAIQLRNSIAASAQLRQRLAAVLDRYVHAPLCVDLHKYHDYPYDMELDYERKPRYV